MMRTIRVTALLAGSFGLFLLAQANAAPVNEQSAITKHMTAEEFSSQSRRILRRQPSRVRIYRGSSYPGPNSVRICNAHYEQEYRPSGTVIVPRMRCYWRG